MSKAPRSYRTIVYGLRLLVRAFFREVEVTGTEHIPTDRGGIIVSWHPNGLIDPGLILTQFPRQVVFGARHGLFQIPLLGRLLKSIGTVPIYRAMDAKQQGPEARREQNRRTLDALAREVARGSFSALFPEGVSHDEPHPVELKTGAARLYYRAQELATAGQPTPVILPVGLHYDAKGLFRSRALVWFHPPMVLPEALDNPRTDDSDEEALKEQARALTSEIERVLHEVVHATDDWEIHDLLHRGRKLIRAERAHRAGGTPGRPLMGEKALAFARVRKAYEVQRNRDPDKVRRLRERVAQYDNDMRALGMEDHEVDAPPDLISTRLVSLLVLQTLLVFMLIPPVLLFGYLINGPTALALLALCRVAAKYKKDEATIKVLVGAIAFPLTWAASATVVLLMHDDLIQFVPQIPVEPLFAAAAVGVVAAVGGAISLRYLNVAAETARAVRVRMTRSRQKNSVDRLRAERAALCDELLKMSHGIALPGVVSEDGRIRAQ